MVYMLVDAPNLEGPLDLDLSEMRRTLANAGPDTEHVYVVVQVRYPSGIFKRHWLRPDRAEFLKAGVVDRETGHGSLCEFVKEVTGVGDAEDCSFNAEHKALVLWGHSAGVAESMEIPLSMLDAGAAGMRKNVGGLSSAALVLKNCPIKLDILCLDACFMSMIELLYELKGRVKYALAPQTSIGLQGWHYDLLLDHILHNSGVLNEPRALGRAAIRQVGLRTSSPTCLALLDIGAVDAVRDASAKLVAALASAVSAQSAEINLRHLVLGAFDGAIWAGARQFLDLADLCRRLASRIPVEAVRVEARNVLNRLNGLVLDQLTTLDDPLGGVSIYCPWVRATTSEVMAGLRNVELDFDLYRDLEFVKTTGYWPLIFHLNNIVPAERRWIRREVSEAMQAATAQAISDAGGRGLDPKPAGRGLDPKPAGRGLDPKPAGRGLDPKPAGRGPDTGRY